MIISTCTTRRSRRAGSRRCRTRRSTSADWLRPDPRGDVGAERGTPKVEGLAETLTHLDDLEWTEVKRQQNADGSVSVVREKWPIATPEFMSAYIEYGPGMITRRHGHFGQHVVFVLAGGAWFGDRWVSRRHSHRVAVRCRVRPDHRRRRRHHLPRVDRRRLPQLGRPGPSSYEQAVADRGVTPLPDPPIAFGDWFEDARSYWAAPHDTKASS